MNEVSAHRIHGTAKTVITAAALPMAYKIELIVHKSCIHGESWSENRPKDGEKNINLHTVIVCYVL